MKKLKTISIKGKPYTTVAERIKYLSEEKEDYNISSEYEYYPERKMWVVKARLAFDGGRFYDGLAQEVESDDYKQVNHASALENAQTSAVGRACAMAGIGITDSMASVDEINKAQSRSKEPTGKFCSICGQEMVTSAAGRLYCKEEYGAHRGKKGQAVDTKPPVQEEIVTIEDMKEPF